MKQERQGIALLEQAIRLVKAAPASAWTIYLSGNVPFFAALIWFIRSTTGVLAVPDFTWPSLLLAILFGWRQLTRSLYSRKLTESIVERESTGNLLHAAPRIWLAGLLRVLICFMPVPWLTALFRNYQAFSWQEEKPLLKAGEFAGRGGDALPAWLALFGMSFVVWLNIMAGFILLPAIYRIFTGEDIELTRNTGALFNRTVVLTALALAWSLCDMALEALYVLRRFYGESERTGADLLQNWRKAIANTGALLLIIVALGNSVKAETPQQKKLDQSINQVLQQHQYQWREPTVVDDAKQSFLSRWVRKIIQDTKEFLHKITRPIRHLWDAFLRWLRKQGDKEEPGKGPGAPVDTLRVISVIVIFLSVIGLAGLLLRTRMQRSISLQSGAAPSPVSVDLADPGTIATDLPEEQWISLARDWMQKGDPRMAMRAWFLGTLAFLNGKNLVTISRYKSNLDYRRELARRARVIAGLEALFTHNVRSFESAWYGVHAPDPSDVERFISTFERMREICK